MSRAAAGTAPASSPAPFLQSPPCWRPRGPRPCQRPPPARPRAPWPQRTGRSAARPCAASRVLRSTGTAPGTEKCPGCRTPPPWQWPPPRPAPVLWRLAPWPVRRRHRKWNCLRRSAGWCAGPAPAHAGPASRPGRRCWRAPARRWPRRSSRPVQCLGTSGASRTARCLRAGAVVLPGPRRGRRTAPSAGTPCCPAAGQRRWPASVRPGRAVRTRAAAPATAHWWRWRSPGPARALHG